MPRARASAASIDLRSAVQALLEGLAPLLLRSRLTPAVVEELARLAFVRVAAGNSRMQSGRVNHSRVATLTGLSRVEVRRLLAAPRRASAPAPRQLDRAARVLEGWTQDGLFRTAKGAPRALPLHGPAPSFEELVRRYSGDMPAASVRKELLRIGAITVREGVVRLARRRAVDAALPGPDPLVELAPVSAFRAGRAGTGASAARLGASAQPAGADGPRRDVSRRRARGARSQRPWRRFSRAAPSVNARSSSCAAARVPPGQVGITVLITRPNANPETAEET
jgi:hypothetical protein